MLVQIQPWAPTLNKGHDMKKIILAAIMTMVFTGSALAESDTGFYVGGSTGTTVNNKQRLDLGFSGGYQVIPNLRGEVTYDYRWVGRSNNLVMGNVIVQQKIPGTAVTPYALAGMGIATVGSQAETAYNVGAGVRVNVSDNVELDARYRYIDTFRANAFRQSGDNMFTVGANYRF